MTNKIRELYDWLKTEGKDIEEECPESIVDAILDKIEESYLEEADPHREGSFFMSTPVVSRKYINDTFDTFFENNSRNFIEDRNNVVRQRIDSKGVLILNMEEDLK